ncbi:hypothetical protein AHiyo6_14190, partial [Arthrobacter sp. Hiyo6]
DVSWPQCGKALPDKPAFAIVGVNNGLANTTNPCLADQLAWAANSTGTTSQPAAALYVNTANPGTAGSWWPTSNTYMDVVVENPYGDCASGDFRACSYMYGYAKAYDDANLRGVDNPGGQFWWLDVETGNSWQTDKAANVADLEAWPPTSQASTPKWAFIRPAPSGGRSPAPCRRRASWPGCQAGLRVPGR